MGQRASKPALEPSANAVVDEDEPVGPVIYLLGKNGYGKSSLIKALTSQLGAQVSHKSAESATSQKWNVTTTSGVHYTFVESHGIFDFVPMDQDYVTRKLEDELTEYKPCAILYVVSCSAVRSAAADFEIMARFLRMRKDDNRDLPPIFVVLSNADLFFNNELWPVEDHEEKKRAIASLLEYTSKEIISAASFEPFQGHSLYYGCVLKECEPIRCIIPVSTFFNENEVSWNVDRLHGLLSKTKNKAEHPYDFEKDCNELQNVIDEVKSMFEVLCHKNKVGAAYEKCRQTALMPIVEFLEELIEKARAPIIYLMGRSGHGKSSLINALTDTTQAEIGHIKPTTSASEEYDIEFKGQNTSWKIVDSRGIFESTIADGSPSMSATEQVEKDLKAYKPDIILHVINCSEARNLAADLKFVKEMFNAMKSEFGELPPVIVVFSKADAFYHPGKWPIEESAEKQEALEQLLDYMGTCVLSSKEHKFLDPAAKYYGWEMEGCQPFIYMIPIASLMVEPPTIWNIDRLNELIGEKMPLQAWLNFYKTHKRTKNMKELAFKVVGKISVISIAVGAIPIPGLSLVFLVPLYTIMVSLVAKLAGREFSTSTAQEFLKTCKLWQGAAITAGAAASAGFLFMAEMIEGVLFGVGCLISGPMTAAATYGLGRAAIAYYFDNEIKAPESYKKEWTPPQT